jgi:uncharacterized protein involved in outer membrane biogenesis
MTRKLRLALAVLAALVVVLLAVPALIDSTVVKAEFAARLEHSLGRPVEISGPLRLRLLPFPQLTAQDLRIANLPGAGSAPMAEIPELRLRLAVLPLLTGSLVAESLVLDHPVVRLQRLGDGRANWTFSRPPETPSAPSAALEEKPHPPTRHSFNIRAIDIRAGTLSWQSGEAAAMRLDGIDAHVALQDDRHFALSLRLPGGESRLDVAGKLSDTTRGPAFDGAVTATLASSGGAFPVTIEGQLAANATEATLAPLTITAGPLRATGSVAAALDGTPRIEVALNAPRVDLDMWHSAGQPPSTPPASPAQPSSPAASPPPSSPAAVSFSLPSNLFVNATLGADTLVWHGQEVRQARIEATLDQGEVMLNRAAADLPGGGSVVADGVLSSRNAAPSYDGHLRADAQDLRPVLLWLGVKPDRIPNLHRLNAAGALTASASEVTFGPATIAVDGTRATGRVGMRWTAGRPSYGVALAADVIDVDALGHAPAPAEATTIRPASPPSVAAPAAETPATPAVPEVSGLAKIDADVDLTVRRLVFRHRTADNVTVAAHLADGAVVIGRAEASLQGASLSLRGALRGLGQPAPVFDGVVLSVRGLRSGYGPVVADMAVTGPLAHPNAHVQASLGAMVLAGDVTGDPRAIDIPTLDIHYGASHLTGSAQADLSRPRPVVTANLVGTAIDLGPVLGGGRSGALPSGPRFATLAPTPPPSLMTQVATRGGGGGGLSHDPIDLSGLNAFDARIAVRAESVSWQGWRLDQPQTHVIIDNGTATLDRLTGKLLDGDMTLTLRLGGSTLPQVSGTLALAGIDLGRARAGHGSVQVTQGRMSGDARFAAAGRSQADMAAHLDGDGRISVRDGTVTGFDLPAVNAQLNHLENIGSVIGLAQAGLSGGATRFSALNATFRAENGIVTTRDARLDADGGNATAIATFDLPQWSVESRIDIRVAGGTSPPLGLRFEGPMDSPRKIIDVNALQRYLVDRGLGKSFKGKDLLEGLLGRRKTPDTAQPPDQPPPPPVTGKQILQDLLKGLGGK